MRKYKGIEPNRIVQAGYAGGLIFVETNAGGAYSLPPDTPYQDVLGRDIYDFKFTRLHKQTFHQIGTEFYRIMDGSKLVPIATYPASLAEVKTSNIDFLERWVRYQFRKDMANQNIIATVIKGATT